MDMEEKDVFAYTTDILIFSISNGEVDNCRTLPNKNFSILLVERVKEPFKDKWCLPGGFVHVDETLDQATDRILEKETNLKNIYKEQLYTFDDIKRDPRRRTISTSYVALIDKNKLTSPINKYSNWFNIDYKEEKNNIIVNLSNNKKKIVIIAKKKLVDETTNRYTFIIDDSSDLAFDHALIILTGLMRLKNKVKDTDIAFNLVPKQFTLGELQQVYEVILGKKLIHSAFRRIIANKVKKVDKKVKTGGHRPSSLFEYKR